MKTNDQLLMKEILGLKNMRKAIILAHNYQPGEIQDIADFVGDSLELSQRAAITDARVIVFCGVHFMAETASILCPEKTVLLPDMNAGCPLADMITARKLRERKGEIPGAAVVCYINSSAEVKAWSDICCTSANAVSIVEGVYAAEVFFVPDQNLGHYVSTKTDKKITLWPGYCPTHNSIQPRDITRLKTEYPNAKVVVHPECQPEVISLADAVLSTSGMCRFARETAASEIIVGTEVGIIYRLEKENPGKKFIPASERAVCPDMKRITPEKILSSLKCIAPEVKVPREIRLRAKAVVDRMLEVS
jgi:quinolinate synthase